MKIFLILCILIIIPYIWLQVCKRLNILEHKKRADYYHRLPVPNIQWIPLWITLLCCIITLGHEYIHNTYMIIYIGATFLLGLLATIDLYKPISALIRLLFQITLFGWIVIIWGVDINTIRLGTGNIEMGSVISIIFSIIRFIVCTNAVNWFDWIQWQSSWVTSIGAFSLFSIITLIVLPSYEHLTFDVLQQLEITKIISLSLGLVALLYTIIEYKPRGLVRDIGTSIYWFSLAYLALLWGGKMWTLIVTLSLVLFDRVRVILHRILIMKKSPLQWDYTHLHHRLLANWWTRSEVRWFVWIRSLVMTVLMILQWTNSFHKRIIMCMMAILFFGVNVYLFWIKKLPYEMKIDFQPQDVEQL